VSWTAYVSMVEGNPEAAPTLEASQRTTAVPGPLPARQPEPPPAEEPPPKSKHDDLLAAFLAETASEPPPDEPKE
jgi:hypothetical protein